LREILRRRNVASIIEQVAAKHGLSLPDLQNHIQVQDSIVLENTSQWIGVSRAIFDHMFPGEPSPAVLYHYTTLTALQGIASSGMLRLYPVRKRVDQGELKAFAQAHRLQGYLDGGGGEPYYKKLSDDLFYVSLTRATQMDEDAMWAIFAAGTGVRLEVVIKPKVAQLRPIHYPAKGGTSLLTDINAALNAAGQPSFMPWSISRIGAFYLPSDLASENEVRLMMKRYEGGTDGTLNDGTYDYWPLPIGTENDLCRLDLTRITVAPNGSASGVASAIIGTVLSTVPVVRH